MMAFCGAAAFTMPAWAEVEPPVLTFVEPDLEAIKGGTRDVFYIYSVEVGKFLANGADYNTSLVVADAGQPITLSWGNDYELIKHVGQADYSDAVSFRMSMMKAPSNGGFHEIFIDPAPKAYVDHGTQGHMLWDIEKVDGTDYYNITVNKQDPTYGTGNDQFANTMVGVPANSDGVYQQVVNPLIVPGSAGYENAAFQWKFVEPSVYEMYAAKKNTLKPQLDRAQEVGYTGIDDEMALYTGTTATPEEIEDAATQLAEDITEYVYSLASESNPMDVTSVIQSPDFVDANGNATTSGWETWRANNNNNFQAQSGRANTATAADGNPLPNFFERWVGSGSHGAYYVRQNLADMPDGKYQLKAYIMCNQTAENGGSNGLYLYASSLNGETSQVAEFASPDGNAYADIVTLDFEALGGDVTIGMRATDEYKGNWSFVAEFELAYLGSSGVQTTMRDLLTQRLAEAQAEYDNEISFAPHSNEGTEKYEAMVAKCEEAIANTALEDDSLKALIGELTLRMDSLQMDVDAYVEFETLIGELNDRWDNSVFVDYDMPTYEEFLNELDAMYNDQTFIPTDLDSIQPRADKAWAADVAVLMLSGDVTDVTQMLNNPNFTGNSSGWSGTSTGWGFDCAEVYQAAFDVYQELTGMPMGSYHVSLQAFQRTTWRDNCAVAWGDETSTVNKISAYAYGNDARVDFPHLLTVLTADTTGMKGNFPALIGGPEGVDGMHVADNMEAASTLFAAGNYKIEFNCFVGSDGVLRVGVKKDSYDGNTEPGTWSIFDNIQITYLGADNYDGAKDLVNEEIARAQEALTTDTVATQTALDTLNIAIAYANSVVDALTEDTYNKAVDTLQAAINGYNADVTLVANLHAKAENFEDKLTRTDTLSFVDYQDTEAFIELENVVDEILRTKYDEAGVFASAEEVDNYSLRLDELFGAMTGAVVDFTGASKDEPVDVTGLIINPSFQWDTLNEAGEVVSSSCSYGWTKEGAGTFTGGLNYEIYEADSSSISQTIKNMPAGYYRLVYNGFYRGGFADVTALNRRDSVEHKFAEVFVTYDNELWRDTVQTILNVIHDTKYYDGGDIFLADSLFPERQDLVYFLIVNNVTGADKAFKDGQYVNDLSFYVAEGKEPTIGLWKTGMVAGDWVCVDNFQLFYLGDGDANRPDDFVSNVEDVISEGTAEVVSTTWVTLDGVKVNAPTQRGIYIRVNKMSDGTLKTTKVLVP